MLGNQRSNVNPQQVVRSLRIVFAVMFASLFLYAIVLIQLHHPSTSHPDQTLQIGLLINGMLTAAIVLYLRFVRIARLLSQTEPVDPATLAKKAWTLYMLCYVISEATALLGFVLAFIHGDPKFYLPLYLGGALLMLSCYPRLPSNDSH